MKSLTAVAGDLGVAKEEIEALLPQVSSELWWPQGRGVTITDEGATAIRALLEKTAAPGRRDGDEEIMRVDRKVINPRIFFAMRSTGEKVQVDVRDATKIMGRAFVRVVRAGDRWVCKNVKPITIGTIKQSPEWAKWI